MAFLDNAHKHLQTVGKVVAVAKTAYDVGKGIYQFAQAAAPFVATLVDVAGLIIYFAVAKLLLSGTLL